MGDGSQAGGQPVLQTKGLTVRFGGVVALDNVDLEVRAGELVGLLGPNGAGKTTLFDTISGLRQPRSGAVVLNGENITHRSATWRARRGMRRTFQRQQAFGWLTTEENILVALEWRQRSLLGDIVPLPGSRRRDRQWRERVAQVLEQCGLTEVREVVAGKLPIGLVRLVEVARAIVDPPSVLLLDEPTSGLDEAEIAAVGRVIDSTRAQTNCAVVLVEHNIPFVMGMSDRVVVLDLGRVIANGTPDEVALDDTVRAAYLGYTEASA
jgi:branched-chain amino acid transport system ATP-binding protein